MAQDFTSDIWLLTAPATRRQTQIAAAVALALLIGLALCAPFAEEPLARIDSFIPTFEGAVILTDLITSILLFSQSSMSRSRALLALASGYLFTSLMVASHVLAFPGAFAPSGLLGGGLQTAGWLYFIWHFGLASAVVVYASLKHEKPTERAASDPSWSSTLGLSVIVVTGVAFGLTLLVIAGEPLLPPVFVDPINLAPLARYILILNALVCAAALLLLWRKRPRSALDMWIMVVTLALLSELVTNSILISARFTFGWYISRLFSIATSTIVLAALLQETIAMYARMARSRAALLRERNTRLLNLEALAGAIRHEVAQPLAAAQMEAEALKLLVREVPPDPDKASLLAEQVIAATNRAMEVIDDIRNLFGTKEWHPAPVNINDVARETLRSLRKEFESCGIVTRVDLTPSLPNVRGQRGQLQEVILNLIQNATDAMRAVDDEARELFVRTERDGGTIKITIADTGPGLDPSKVDQIFEPFFTTKPTGLGLGLPICKMIIDRHGGQISVSARKPRGTIIEVTLPTADATPEPVLPAARSRPSRWFGRFRPLESGLTSWFALSR